MSDNKPFLIRKLIDFWRGNVEPSEIFWTMNIVLSVITMLEDGFVEGMQMFSFIAMIYALFLGMNRLIKSFDN